MFKQKLLDRQCSGCGGVGKVVAFSTGEYGFKSQDLQNIHQILEFGNGIRQIDGGG